MKFTLPGVSHNVRVISLRSVVNYFSIAWVESSPLHVGLPCCPLIPAYAEPGCFLMSKKECGRTVLLVPSHLFAGHTLPW